MKGIALDTNIVSAHLRGDEAVGSAIRAEPRLYMPVTVLGELYYGAYHTTHSEKQLHRVRSFLPLVETIHYDDEVASEYGRMKSELARLGTLIPENDMWIAAACLVFGLPLATRDGHFQSVPNLTVLQW
jgi:tRNA(fMet)-specific endonuclease VapC